MNSDLCQGLWRVLIVAVLNLEFLSFEFVSHFDIRFSDFFKTLNTQSWINRNW